MNNILLGDCIDVMQSNSVDLILTDLPYGTTKNIWDTLIDMRLFWKYAKEIMKPNAVVVLHGQGLFSAKIILSNERMYRYSWVWQKTNATGFLNAKKMPLRAHEDILVFMKKNLPTTLKKLVGIFEKCLV